MIIKNDLDLLYFWAKTSEFKLSEEPTSAGYPTKPILYCPFKLVRNTTVLKKRNINSQMILKILSNPDILFCAYVSLQPGTEHGPHKDLNAYAEEFKRIQIPIKVPSKEKCYMIWQGQNVTWELGQYKMYEVMDYTHEGYNYSEDSLEFLFVDVKKDTLVEL
jgi:hypothetical protein